MNQENLDLIKEHLVSVTSNKSLVHGTRIRVEGNVDDACRYTFKDEKGKLAAISYNGCNYVGIILTPSDQLWLVDDTIVPHLASNKINMAYWKDKHLLRCFNNVITDLILEYIK